MMFTAAGCGGAVGASVGWAVLSGIVSGSSASAPCRRSHTARKYAHAKKGGHAIAPRIYHHFTAKNAAAAPVWKDSSVKK